MVGVHGMNYQANDNEDAKWNGKEQVGTGLYLNYVGHKDTVLMFQGYFCLFMVISRVLP